VKGVGGTKRVFCPNCREQHTAGADTPTWLWFTCEAYRFELPEEQARLGSKAYELAREAGLLSQTGCMRCGQTAMCTEPEDDLVRYVCHRCGEVGQYLVVFRSNWRQSYQPYTVELFAGQPAHETPSVPPELACGEAGDDEGLRMRMKHRWRQLTAWAEGGY
jgi:ribosomal protein S27AE